MKKLLTFLTLLTLSIGVGWAETETITFSATSGNGTNYSFTTGRDGGTTNPAYNANTGQLRLYNGCYITVTSSTKKIQSIAFSAVFNRGGSGNNAYTPNWSDFTIKTGTGTITDGTWTAADQNTTSITLWNSSGKGGNIGLTQMVITYVDESGSSVSDPVITLSPERTYYEGDEVTATLACETEGATIYYRLNDDATWTEYSTALTLTQTTTIHAKAVLGTDESSEKTQTVTFKKSVANIAAFKALSDADAADFKFTGDVVVTYFNENDADYLWIKDNTGSTLLYQSNLTSNVEQGDIIGGGWTGNRTIYKGLVEIKGVTDAAIAQGSETVNPIDLNYTPHFASTDYQAVYGKLSGVTCTVKNSNNSNFTITDVNGNEIAGHDTYNMWPADFSTEKTYNITGIVSVYNSAQFIPVLFEEVTEDPGDGYYLVGNFNMDGDNWVTKDARYKFSGEGTTLTLNNITLPDNVQFKIIKWEGETQTWYGGLTDNDNQQNPYGLHRDWHTNIPLTNSYGNNKVKNFSIAAGAVTNFTLNTSTLKFDVQRDEQLYVKGDFNEWGKTPMNSTSTGWTINQAISAEDEFGFVDEWGDWHGGDGYWIYQEEHEAFGETKPSDIGQELDITSSGNFYMVTAGTYTLNVNSDLTTLTVYVPLAINCSAVSDVPNGEGGYKPGGTIVAKVNGNTAEYALTGETVTLDITPWNGYTLSSVTLNGNALTANEGVYSFEMPAVAANVVANFTVNYYDLVLQNDETLGEVSGLPQNMKAYTGQEVSFSVTALGENEIDKVTYEYNGGNPQTLTATEGIYTFNMPPFEVTIKVTYIEPLQPCTIPFVETWDGTNGTGANDGNWNGTIASATIVSDNEGWEYFAGSGAKQCAKFGTSNTSGGSATTPEILVSAGTTYTMTFRAAAWNAGTEKTTLNLSAEGATLYENENCEAETELSSIELVKGEWTTYTVYVKATSNKMKITWYTEVQKNRFFLDDVNIPKPEPVVEPTEVTLAELCENGVTTEGENRYAIADEYLVAVEVREVKIDEEHSDVYVWCKDDNNIPEDDKLTPADGVIDFMIAQGVQPNSGWDQSNWVVLRFKDGGLAEKNLKGYKVTGIVGTYVDATNYMIDVESYTKGEAKSYTPNVYCVANFNSSNWGDNGVQQINDEDEAYGDFYFFMTPKVQEVCHITFAEWNGSTFTVPANSGFAKNTLTLGWDYNQNAEGTPVSQAEATANLTTGNNSSYQFDAIVQASTGSKGAITGVSKVYPTNLTGGDDNNVPTAINTVETGNGEVKSVKYVNVAGIVSDVPFEGVNIVVTEYTDGSRTTSKMLKK